MIKAKHSSLFAIALTLSGAIALSGCSEEAPVVVEEEGIAGITIENARMVLAPVEGNPAALYFDFAYDGDRAFNVDRFSITGTESAVMHQYGEYDRKIQMMEALPIPVTGGTTLEFKPGDLHVMAMGVSAELQPGGTTEVTMKVSGGDTHSFTAEIRAPGEDR